MFRASMILLFFISCGQTLAQLTLVNKVYESGSKAHFDNFKKCEFYFECDCCNGKLLFTTPSNFLLINYCMPDFVITKGNYEISNDNVTLNSDGSRIDVLYNWELEFNPDAEPGFFVKDSLVGKYQLNYKIDKCNRTMLVNKQESGTFIAIESDMRLSDELDRLKKYGLEKILNLK